jgi:hypothetical protein
MRLSAELPQDDEGAKLMRFEDVRGQRYTEIFLIGGHAITRHLVGGIYNTIGLNDPTGTGDTSPQPVLDQVDVDELKQEYDLLGAFKNGPRLWTLDWAEVMVGGEASPAFLLDDPGGDSWCMKSASLAVDPHQTYQSLKDLGSRLQPAPGWNFRAVVLDQDLVLTADDGAVKITQDELGNTYDRVGGPYSNYKP